MSRSEKGWLGSISTRSRGCDHVIVVTRKNFPAANLKELIDQLSPGKISAGTAGAGSGSHIAGLLLQSLTGVHLSFVPYRGTNVTAE